MKWPILLVTILIASASAASEADLINQLTNPSRYNAKVRPEGRVVDTINVYVRNIDYVDDLKQEYKMQVTFRQQWNDHRFNSTDPRTFPVKGYITITDSKLVWTPDIFFSNEKSGHRHDIVTPNEMVRIYPNGDVLYSIRLTLVLGCKMDFHKFPSDSHKCEMRVASYAYTQEELFIQWRNESPVQMSSTLSVPLFRVGTPETSQTSSSTITGTYSSASLILEFSRRHYGYYWLHFYIPTSMMVLLGYLSLWAKDSRVRYLLSLSSLLVAALAITFLNARLPGVSYTKGIDVWTGICLTFIMATLVLHVIVDNLISREGNSRLTSATVCLLEESGEGTGKRNVTENATEHGPPGSSAGQSRNRKNSRSTASGLIAVARVAYPICYFAFMLLYGMTMFFF